MEELKIFFFSGNYNVSKEFARRVDIPFSRWKHIFSIKDICGEDNIKVCFLAGYWQKGLDEKREEIEKFCKKHEIKIIRPAQLAAMTWSR